MEQRLSVVTLGVADLDRSRRFYEDGLGWRRGNDHKEVVFFQTGGMILALYSRGGSQASIDRSSSIPRSSAKRAKSAIEALTMRSALETTQVRRRNRASQCRWREWSRSMPWVSSLPTNSRPCGISSA